MNRTKIEKIVEEISQPIVDALGYELVDVEFIRENREWYLRIYIDKEEGITLDDCARASRVISDKLDETDPIDYSYFLEVSSPGIDRPLKKDSDFAKFVDNEIVIKLYKALDGRKVITGTLKGLENDTILINLNGEDIKIDRSLASSIRLKGI